MNNSYKSYGVWEGVRKDPGGGWSLGGGLGGQGSKKELGSGRELGDSGGGWVWMGLGSRKKLGSQRGSGVSEGVGGSQMG